MTANAPKPAAGKEAATAEKPKTESAAKDKKEKAAPRPRKYDYGIQPDNTIVRLEKKDADGKPVEVTVKAGLAADWEKTKGNPTVAKYFEAGGTRHGLRVFSRNKLINIKSPDGKVYPTKYVAPEPKPKADKPKAAKKKVAAKKAAPKPAGAA